MKYQTRVDLFFSFEGEAESDHDARHIAENVVFNMRKVFQDITFQIDRIESEPCQNAEQPFNPIYPSRSKS